MKDNKEPVYMIGIAAKKLKIHPQTLRMYEREKLVIPKRTSGSTRLYSDYDIKCIKEIQHLTQEMGLNLAGVRLIFEMKEKSEEMKKRINEFNEEMNSLQKKMDEQIDKVHKSYKHEIVLYRQSPLAILKHLEKLHEDNNNEEQD